MAKKTTTTTKLAAPAKRAAAKPATKPKPAAKPKAQSAQSKAGEAIALRAYFLAETRRREGISGDAHQDWLEAERQIAAEKSGARKTKKA